MIHRKETIEHLRQRLEEVINRSRLSRSAFARRAGIDRSTLSQILSTSGERLPRVETLAAIATREQVSIDWLVGISEEGPLRAAILNQSLQIEPGGLSPTDEKVEGWRAEALGYKIRHVPLTLPDLLKIDDVIEYEYRKSEHVTADQRREATQARLEYQRRPETDTEVCGSIQQLVAFVRGEGTWTELPWKKRRRQLVHMIELTQELYPTFRWFLYDRSQRYSAPLTVFGPKRAVIYLGQRYLVLNSREHIQVLTSHFDDLIRAAVVQPPDLPDHLAKLLDKQER